MLIIRDTQFNIFEQTRQRAFADALVEVLRHSYPHACRQAGGAAAVATLVARALASAAEQGYTSGRPAGVYVALTVILGVDFQRDPQLPWVADYLDDTDIADPTQRIEQLFARTIDYLGVTGGEHGECMARAVRRLAALDLGAIAPSIGERWLRDMARLCALLYPEKYAEQGKAATLAMLRAGMACAARHRLRGRADFLVYLALMFLLGSGFDHDPLHPWAGAILHGSDAQAGATRGARLHAAAIAHLTPAST